MIWLITLGALAAVDAPVTDVTVYSDRARVVRAAHLSVNGSSTVELPLLLDGVDTSTIRVESTGAEVRRVELERVPAGEIPLDEGRKLLGEIESVTDDLRHARVERETLQQQISVAQRLTPQTPPSDPLKAPVKLDPSDWAIASKFGDEYVARLESREREPDKRIRQLERKQQELAERARLLGAGRRSGWRVRAFLEGSGATTVTMTYQIAPASWLPSYDVQLVPEKGEVKLSFSGLVSQATGEDWSDAQLTLSTAVPATSTQFPKLATWKIGQRDRFIPTPQPVVEPIRPAPPAAPPSESRDEREEIRSKLLAAASMVQEVDEDQRATRTSELGAGYIAPAARVPPPPPPLRRAGKNRAVAHSAPREESPPKPAPVPMVMDMEPAAEVEKMDGVQNLAGASIGRRQAQARPRETTGASLAPPESYQPPVYSSELPASEAGGYDLSYRSARPETIESGKGARRVALFTESWPVSVERKIFPALAHEAFLVADLKSPAKQLLPGGPANLFVGADPSGTAHFKRVAPGESFTLPLGLDRAIKVIHNVQVVDAEKGLIGKDDVSEYVVTDELANPYPVAINVKIFDQCPLTDDKEVQLKLLGTDPYALQDPVKGSLEWDLTVAPHAKAVVSFRYSLRRPKNWRMHQSQ